MNSVLEIRRPNVWLIARIESIDKKHTISYAADKFIKESLEKVLNGGIDSIIITDGRQIHINAIPGNSNFLEQLMQYLQLSFDYICTYKVAKD